VTTSDEEMIMNILAEPFLVMCIVAVAAFSMTMLGVSISDAMHGRSLDN
jgi:hypothetical protein